MELGALGFWLFIAAIIVAGVWEKSRREAERHETLRRIVEKTGTIDEAKLKELFTAAPAEESKPGSGSRSLRITGVIVMFLAAGLAIIFATIGLMFGDQCIDALLNNQRHIGSLTHVFKDSIHIGRVWKNQRIREAAIFRGDHPAAGGIDDHQLLQRALVEVANLHLQVRSASKPLEALRIKFIKCRFELPLLG